MTARVVLSCDGQEGIYPCRQAIPVGAIQTGREARLIAKRDGWSSALISRPKEGIIRARVEDFCPSCTRKNR